MGHSRVVTAAAAAVASDTKELWALSYVEGRQARVDKILGSFLSSWAYTG